jgi:hypothetical protein
VKPSQLEALVLAAVEALRAGTPPEDDRFEFKREWPEVKKARQLAGAANRANGEPLIYVIGIDEKTGEIHPVADDPAEWWARMQSEFDDAAPELVTHVTTFVSEGEAVIALLFRTDRAPYCVRIVNIGPIEREVPMRDGTRTRSASRRELLRLLLPTVQVPQLVAVKGTLRLGPPEYYGGDSNRVVHVTMRTQIYFEHIESTPTFLPLHSSFVELSGGLLTETSPVYLSGTTRQAADVLPFSPNVRRDGLLLTGSGVVYVQAQWEFPVEQYASLSAIQDWTTRVVFGVAGTERLAATTITYGDRGTRGLADTGHVLQDETTWSTSNGGIES